jgi:cytochrome P450
LWKNGNQSETVQEGHHVVANRDVLSMTMDILSLVAYGNDMDFLRAEGSVGPDLLKLMNIATTRTFLAFLPYWKIPLIGQYLDGAAWPKHRLLRYFNSLVKEHESMAEEAPGPASKDNHKSRTFLSKAIALRRSGATNMSNERLVGNLATLFAAGSETTHVTICSALWEIATDTTGLQDELAFEAQRMKDMENASVEELLNGFPRIRSFMYEILRLKGPVRFLSVECMDEISICGTKVPPRTGFILPIRYISTKSPLTPSGPLNASASDFCARRYLLVDKEEYQSTTTTDTTLSTKEKNLSVVKPCYKTGFNSFGNGRRVCPGRDLAEMEIIICLASVLRKFVVTLKEDHPPMKLVTRLSQSPNMNIMLSLQPRGRMHTSSSTE